jgi:hypothetical protein
MDHKLVGPDLAVIEMTAEEKSRLGAVAGRLERLLAASTKFVAPSADSPLENSPMKDAYEAGLHEPYHQAFLQIFSTEDHLRSTLALVKNGPIPGFSLYTLLRAASEAAVRGRYLLDPAASEPTRLARALSERLYNLQQMRKFSRAPDLKERYERRIAHLEERALANGITPFRKDPAAPITGFEEPRQSSTALFARYLPEGSLTFSFLSGYTHSMLWIVLRREAETSPSYQNVRLAPTDLEVPLFADVLTSVLDLHDENLRQWLRLAGYPAVVWTEARRGSPT